jgi:hypothetical protein
MLLALGYSEPSLFVSVPRLLHRNLYLWRVCVIIYKRPMTDHIYRIYHVVEATTPRWTFEGGMREESSQKIAELEALCKRLREDAQKLREENATLEGVFQSHDELIKEMAEEYGLNRMGENNDDEDEDGDDEGNAITPLRLLPYLRRSS